MAGILAERSRPPQGGFAVPDDALRSEGQKSTICPGNDHPEADAASPELVLSEAERTVPPGPIEMETTGSRPLAESADGRIHAA